MDADCRVHERVLFGELDSSSKIWRPVTVPNGDHGRDSGFASACDDFRAIGLELLAIEMCVRVDEHGNLTSDLRPRTSEPDLRPFQPTSKKPRSEVQGLRSDALFQACSYRHILQKAGQHWLATLERSSHDHPVGLQSTHLPRREVCNNHDLASDQGFRRIGFSNSGEDLANFSPDINFQAQQFVRLGHTFRDFDLAYTQFDLRKIINGDLSAAVAACASCRSPYLSGGCLRLRLLPRSFRSGRSLLIFHLLHPSYGTLVGSREYRTHIAQLCAPRQLSPGELIQVDLLDVPQSHLFPNLHSRIRNDWMCQCSGNPQRFRGGIQNSCQACPACIVLLLA